MLQSPAINRRQPLLGEKGSPASGRRVGEVAGGTAAECAAICCCCPCAAVNLLVMAVYKVPTGLCKKAWKKKKKQRLMKKKEALLLQQQQQKQKPNSRFEESGIDLFDSGDDDDDDGEGSTEEMDFEMEMCDRFYGAGFWRSPSHREDL